MYSVSEEYAKKIVSDDRAFAIKLTFDTSTVLTGTTIQDITLDEVTNNADVLTMGCACSNKITVNLINPPTNFTYDESVFKAEVGLLLTDRPVEYEWVPLGTFYVTEVETNNDFKNLKLTAYDGFCKMTDKYNAAVSPETTLQDVYEDLRGKLGGLDIELKERKWEDDKSPNYAIPNFPYLDITYAQAIGYVAGCLGGFARFDRLGKLEIVWYEDSGLVISRAQQYMNGFSRTSNAELSITSISTGTKENAIVYGDGSSGTDIAFENPYITDEMANDIYETISESNIEYAPCNVKWRGNPAVQAGDIVRVIDKDNVPHTVFVMSQSLKVGGGCSATIECKGTNATKAVFTQGFERVGQKIERVYTTLEKAIINATNAITGNKGGYVVMHDYSDENTPADGVPDEILIMDNPNIDVATKVWRWNKEGLGYSSNGYDGPYATAITADGQIVADFITTGTLSAERIAVENFDADDPTKITDYIRFEDGTITLGKGDSAIILKLENDRVAFYSGTMVDENGNEKPKPIAYFSNNSFEIENLTDGKIRFQNFGFIPRASGNLSFTKLI